MAGLLRDVTETIVRQIVVARNQHGFVEDDGGPSRVVLEKCKDYLARNSASNLPPALASVYGLGSTPFLLYRSVGFDRLHAIDLGIEWDLTDKAFIVFNSYSYNKAILSKLALVRIFN